MRDKMARTALHGGSWFWVAILAGLLAACGGGATSTSPTTAARQPSATLGATTTTASPGVLPASPGRQETASAVVRRWIDAANRGDLAAVVAAFAPDARFDSEGRIFVGREAIGDFMQREVIGVGGQYRILDERQDGDAVVFEFDFRAGALVEHFTYRCVVRDGLVRDVVGRYVRASATPAVATDLPVPVRCYVDTVNARDLAGLVACFAPDATIIDVSRRIVGAEAIRTWAGNEVIGGNLRVLEATPRDGGVRLLVHWAPAGSSGWRAYYTFAYRDGRITLADLQYAN